MDDGADSISNFSSSAIFFDSNVFAYVIKKMLILVYSIQFVPPVFLTDTFSPPAGGHFRFNHDCIRFAGPS